SLKAGGRVVGVIPDPLATKEIAHDGLSELFIVRGMHERKALMASLSAGFLTLPGGIGTYEELFEILTWSALGLHRKPIGILNVAGYFDPLLSLLDHAVSEGFLKRDEVLDIVVSDDPDTIAGQLLEHRPRSKHRTWIKIDET
ncbi:LOG family protein, partial [Singulisphaera rosea]